jgi:hypothetical protein
VRYRIACTDEEGSYFFYCNTEESANVLFNMATQSKFFTYVELEVITEGYSRIREWSEDDG